MPNNRESWPPLRDEGARNHREMPSAPGAEDAPPPELQAVDALLRADSAAWEADLPAADRVVGYAAALPPPEPAPRGAVAGRALATSDTSSHPLPEAHTRRPARMYPTQGDSSVATTRSRALLGGVAVVVIVALFAVLLHSLAGTQTSTTNHHKSWKTYPGLKFSTTSFFETQPEISSPAIAPSDPHTVYFATIKPPALHRTRNLGSTWTTLPLPQFTWAPVLVQTFASPLDAQTVFLQVTLAGSAGQAPPACVPEGSTGTTPMCIADYYSADGGATWQAVSLPGPSIFLPAGGSVGEPDLLAPVIQAQGQRLFALGQCISSAGDCPSFAQLLSSADGGATWHATDSALHALGQGTCEFALSPAGEDIYILAGSQHEGLCTGYQRGKHDPIDLWHSADSGTHWTHVGQVPDQAGIGIVAVPQNNGQPLLYVDLPAITIASQGIETVNLSAATLGVSADGGHTWHHASALQGHQGQDGIVGIPQSMLGDGTVLGMRIQGCCTSVGSSTTIYGWQLGSSRWRQIAPTLSDLTTALLVEPGSTGNGGAQTLWVVQFANDYWLNPSVATYQIESYTL